MLFIVLSKCYHFAGCIYVVLLICWMRPLHVLVVINDIGLHCVNSSCYSSYHCVRYCCILCCLRCVRLIVFAIRVIVNIGFFTLLIIFLYSYDCGYCAAGLYALFESVFLQIMCMPCSALY